MLYSYLDVLALPFLGPVALALGGPSPDVYDGSWTVAPLADAPRPTVEPVPGTDNVVPSHSPLHADRDLGPSASGA